MSEYKMLSIKENPQLIDFASNWFSQKWGITQKAYQESMQQALQAKAVPSWYLCYDEKQVVGGIGVIENDFHDRKDLAPNVCAVYVEKAYRGQKIAGLMLQFVCQQMSQAGIDTLYLITDHENFYQRYGWQYYGEVKEDSGSMTKMFVHTMEKK